MFELRSYSLRPGKLLEWESAWYALSRQKGDLLSGVTDDVFDPDYLCIGGRGLKRAKKPWPLLVRGSRRSESYIRYTTFGSQFITLLLQLYIP